MYNATEITELLEGTWVGNNHPEVIGIIRKEEELRHSERKEHVVHCHVAQESESECGKLWKWMHDESDWQAGGWQRLIYMTLNLIRVDNEKSFKKVAVEFNLFGDKFK